MSTIASLQLSKRAMGNVAAAVVTAGVALAALTASAMAAPFDTVNIDSSGVTHEFQFGDTCTAGAAPTSSGDELNWGENAGQTNVTPVLVGNLCLQHTTAEARVVLEYRDNNHVVVGRYPSNPALGNGSSLNTFAVNKTGPRVTSATINHIHVQIQQRVAGQWQDVAGAVEFLDYP